MTDETTTPEVEAPEPAEKPKRKRRTKAEIEADNKVAADGTDREQLTVLMVAELLAQDERWGEQNHPLIGGLPERERLLQRNYRASEVQYQRMNAGRVDADTMGWDSILLEEVFEALGESDPDKAVTELIQVAAVAIQAAASIRRQAV